MVIQRIQTLYLLVAALLMALFCFLPFAVGAELDYLAYRVADAPTLLVLGIVCAALLLLDIFLFKTLRLQMRVARIALVLTLVTAAMSIVVCSRIDGAAVNVWCGIVVPLAALVATWLALRGMAHDHKLLSSADRLR